MMQKVAIGGIAVLLLAMGWVNTKWLDQPIDIFPITVSREATDLKSANSDQQVPGSPQGGEQIGETFLRPLFYPSRRPFEPAPAPVEVLAVEEVIEPAPVDAPSIPSLPTMRLVGISLAGSQRRALLGVADGTAVRWYSPGDNVEGWVLSAINQDTVILASGSDNFQLALYPNFSRGRSLP